MFWPKSKTQTPGFGWVTVCGARVSTTRIGSHACATSVPPGGSTKEAMVQRMARDPPPALNEGPPASYAGVSQPGSSSRASTVSPS